MVEEFEKDIVAIIKSSVPEAVTWQELREETHSDIELLDLKEAIARGHFIFTKLADFGGLVIGGPKIVVPRTLQIKVVKLVHEGHQDQGLPVYQSVVSRAGQNGGIAHPTLPPMPSAKRVTGARGIMHDTHAHRALERCCGILPGPHP